MSQQNFLVLRMTIKCFAAFLAISGCLAAELSEICDEGSSSSCADDGRNSGSIMIQRRPAGKMSSGAKPATNHASRKTEAATKKDVRLRRLAKRAMSGVAKASGKRRGAVKHGVDAHKGVGDNGIDVAPSSFGGTAPRAARDTNEKSAFGPTGGLKSVARNECYISQCGCPWAFQERWCDVQAHKITTAWCMLSESNCNQCSGTWCVTAVATTVTTTPAPIPQATCDDWFCSAGSKTKAMASTIVCPGGLVGCTDALCCDIINVQATCDFWMCSAGFLTKATASTIVCPGGPAGCSDALCCDQATVKATTTMSTTVAGGSSGYSGDCMIKSCGCAPFINSYCTSYSIRDDPWCWKSKGNCLDPRCDGVWCPKNPQAATTITTPTTTTITTATTTTTTTTRTTTTTTTNTKTVLGGGYACGTTISKDCRVAYDESMTKQGSVTAFCVRCATEGGAFPLRSRCVLCCDLCGVTTAPSTTTMVTTTTTMTTTKTTTTVTTTTTTATDTVKGIYYTCGDTIDGECRAEYTRAIRLGSWESFCFRCASEGGAKPLRSRCSMCCSACGVVTTSGQPGTTIMVAPTTTIAPVVNDTMGVTTSPGGTLPSGSCYVACCPEDPDDDACVPLLTQHCQEAADNCVGDCMGVWCAATTVVAASTTISTTRAANTSGALPSTCYIADCNCPPFTLEKDWCVQLGQINVSYCQSSEARCTEECDGVWCAATTVAVASTTIAKQAVVSTTGAATARRATGTIAPSTTGAKQGVVSRTGAATTSGATATIAPSTTGAKQAVVASTGAATTSGAKATTVVATTGAATTSGRASRACYIPRCGCPPFAINKLWCVNIGPMNSSYCQQAESNCVNDCMGSWCGATTTAVTSTTVAPTTVAPTTVAVTTTSTVGATGSCNIRRCGCPPYAVEDAWCVQAGPMNSAYCDGNKTRCETHCYGKWCGATTQAKATVVASKSTNSTTTTTWWGFGTWS